MAEICFNLRIDEEINDILIKIANKEERSKNKQIEYILKKFIEDYLKDNKDI